MPAYAPIHIRFWRYVTPGRDEECWEWQGAKRHKGYGQIRGPKRTTLKAHRVSWEIHFGPIPDGKHVLHRCDNPPCVNPSHLFLGDPAVNGADMASKGRGRTKPLPGELNPAAKLTSAEVAKLRAMQVSGWSFRALARHFGLNKKTVAGIVRRETWRHV